MEHISILNCSSAVERINLTAGRLETLDLETETEDSDFIETLQHMTLSLFAENIIEYIAGFVAHSLVKKIHWNKCVKALISLREKKNTLIYARDKGGLIYPSDTVINICRRCEVVIRTNDNYKIVKPERRAMFFVTKTAHLCK